jgi:hypothetical protein
MATAIAPLRGFVLKWIDLSRNIAPSCYQPILFPCLHNYYAASSWQQFPAAMKKSQRKGYWSFLNSAGSILFPVDYEGTQGLCPAGIME